MSNSHYNQIREMRIEKQYWRTEPSGKVKYQFVPQYLFEWDTMFRKIPKEKWMPFLESHGCGEYSWKTIIAFETEEACRAFIKDRQELVPENEIINI